ncbi:MAG: serine/threonine-protein phosphatase [Acidimicrobiia bacterium]|nr:serine/threonine-protein phosphatase [Acidimicrobiia bacterium]
METPVLLAVAFICLMAAGVWARSARLRYRFLRRLEDQSSEPEADVERLRDARTVARAGFRREVHASSLYFLLSVASFFVAVVDDRSYVALFALVALPAIISLLWGRNAVIEARAWQARYELERRAEEALEQEDLAPKAWAARLAPDELPDFSGFEVGRVYQAGSGLMAGDFFDIFRVAPTRLAAVIGDVSGHGVESSISAFQAKYLLRVYLRQFRDPAQALEELNRTMSDTDRTEEFISLVVVVFDTEAGTLRYASAGHPASLLWHEREVQPLRATGPLLMLDPKGSYYSREISLKMDDTILMYTDGLSEVRHNDEQFGEERIATVMRRDPGIAPDVLCKSLLEVARDYAAGPIHDDVAIMAIRRN